MQCFTELTPPTAVTHSLSLPFLSPSANNLIIAKTNLLQIFSLKSIITVTNDAQSSGAVNGLYPSKTTPGATRSDRLHTTKLVLIAQYELSGTITSLAGVKILQSKSGGEALLVSLRDAKLSLVEWDPERYCISTISIHYYEREDILSSPWEPDLSQSVNYLSVDPSSRCAVLKFGTRHLAILPFHQVGDDLVGDDHDTDDYDPDIDGERPERKTSVSKPDVDGIATAKTPYAASFVLSLLALDPNLSNPLHLCFLFEYREPTFGVLHSQVASSTALLSERRDNVSYAVYTLDLEQRASTTLLSLNGLPYDLFAVVPLSRVIGGALLMGCNEIIHVDQSGKTTAVAVNEFARQTSSFAMADQSDLNMRLEHCMVKQLGLDNTDLLLILNTGQLAVLSFKIDGRSVSGISIRRVSNDNGGNSILAGASSASIIGRGRMFIGSEDSDSLVLGWSRGSNRIKRQKSRMNVDADGGEDDLELDEEDIEDDEDDLYAETNPVERTQIQGTSLSGMEDDYKFRVHDRLLNYGPMTDVAMLNSRRDRKSPSLRTDILSTSGRGEAGGLTLFQQDIRPNKVIKHNLVGAQGVWSVRTKAIQEDTTSLAECDRYLIVSNEAKSTLYAFKPDGLEEVKDTEFDSDAGPTIDIGMISGGTRTIQALQSELRIYDGDFGLAQILPLADEDSDEEPPKVISASFADPYVLLIMEDHGAMVLTEDDSGDLEIIEKGEALKQGEWLSGSLYEDSNDNLRLEFPEESEDEVGNVLLFLLSAAGGLQIFRLPNLNRPVYRADGLSFLPPFLSTEFTIRRSSAKESVTEVLMTELGDADHKSPFLIVRSAKNDLVIYQPYQSPIKGNKETPLRFLKLANWHLPRTLENPLPEDGQEELPQPLPPLRQLHDVGGYSSVFMPGPSPCFIIKSASSAPHVIDVAEISVRSLTQLHISQCQKGFFYVDGEGNTHAAQLPSKRQYETGWVSRRVALGEEVHALSYQPEKDAYVLGTSSLVPFKLPDDEFHIEWAAEQENTFLPLCGRDSIKLLDGKTFSVVDSYALETYEVVTTIKTLSLEVSEHTHARETLVCVGTALIRGEDLPSAGKLYVFAVIDVVPEPDRLETGHALKLIAKEDVHAAVTALSGVGTQGFLLVAQGQKCMVRGLKEDGSILPVAFMDMQCYVSVVRELPGTGLCLMGDAIKGLCLTGYMEEPYSLRLFGKSPHHIEVIAADLLPDNKQLFMAVADADCNIHILQFDPDNPKSLSGQRLLHHSTFHTSHFPSSLTLLSSPPESTITSSSILITTQSGSLALLTPLPASAHRTLTALQSHLQNTLPHALGLNPRSYRTPSTGPVGEATAIGRGGVIDGMVIRRWMEGGSWRRWGGGDAGGELGGEEGLRELIRLATGGGIF